MNQSLDIQTAVVVGAGIMGSGIAAHLANAGVNVHLLDIVPAGAEDRNVIANSALQRMLKATPATDPLSAGFMVPANARRVTPGNIEDDLETVVPQADWIVEVVVEDLETKRNLYARLDALRKPGAIVSSNTSTIPLQDLVAGRSEDFRRHFVITHFFNPPRFMHLLELVNGADTDPAVSEKIRRFCDVHLGKHVIVCKDTPAFIANRIGIYYMFRTMTEALHRKARIEEVDAVMGRPMGYPKDGIFGLLDLVGIGVIPHVAQSMLSTLPADDAFRQLDSESGLALVNRLLADGRSGRKSPKGGFYRMQKAEDGKKQKQALNLETDDYYDVGKPRLKCVQAAKKQGPRGAFEAGDPLGDLAWVVMRDTLLYAAGLIPQIADDIADVDSAMRDGYNAKWGPFELMDRVGVAWFTQRVLTDGLELPQTLILANNRPFYREHNGQRQRLVFDFDNNRADYAELTDPEGILSLAGIKRKGPPLLTHHSASLWDLGDGITCFEVHSKMNTLDPSVMWVLNQAITWMTQHSDAYRGMVVYTDASNFSLGANLGLIQAGFTLAKTSAVKALGLSDVINNAMVSLVDALVFQGQSVYKAMRDAPFPVVGAPHGMALGGGCELLLHCDTIQASAETYTGLVEAGVGVIPAWGGCVRYLERALHDLPQKGGPVPPVRSAFQMIMMPQTAVSASGQDAQGKGWLRPGDGITMNRERLLADAKAKVLAMTNGYTTPESAVYTLPGPCGKSALRMAIDDFYVRGEATWHDVVVADALADVLTGGDTHVGIALTESDIYHLERQAFLSLIRTRQTRQRIAHTLKTGKPLREEPLTEKKSVDELRNGRPSVVLAPRTITGKPLEGSESIKLRLMAAVTALLLKQVSR